MLLLLVSSNITYTYNSVYSNIINYKMYHKHHSQSYSKFIKDTT